VNLGWLPTGGYIAFTDDPVDGAHVHHAAISLACCMVGLLGRITRSTCWRCCGRIHRTARAKGLPNRLVVMKHALSNALIRHHGGGHIVSLLVSGSVVTRHYFPFPHGQLLTQAVLNRDYPMVQGGCFWSRHSWC